MIVPAQRPQLNDAKVRALLVNNGLPIGGVSIVGVRGYYMQSMGDPTANDRGIYDDAFFVSSPSAFATFNANTDPSIRRPGVAVLACGVWKYQLGIHGLSKPVAKRYPALVQAGEVMVLRDGKTAGSTPKSDVGFFGINIHKGSALSTSSLGCQTLFPNQWDAFFQLVKHEMLNRAQKTISYLLVEDPRLSGGAAF